MLKLLRRGPRSGRWLWRWSCRAAAHAQEGSTISLGVGTQKVITVPGIARIAVGDPSIADVKTIGNNQILIIGAGEGKTTLLVWKSSGQRISYLVVRAQAGPQRGHRARSRSCSARSKASPSAWSATASTSTARRTPRRTPTASTRWSSLYPNVKSFVKIAPNAKKLVAQNLNAAFQKAGLKNVQANVVGSTIFLEGSVESQQDLQKAELITKAIGEKVENLLVVGIKRMILSEVQFVEIRRNGKRPLRHQVPHRHRRQRDAPRCNINQGPLPRATFAGHRRLRRVTRRSDFAHRLPGQRRLRPPAGAAQAGVRER